MKIGMNMLLWTGHVTQEHVPALKAIKATGFDGVEIPVFDASAEAHYRWLAGVLDDIGLERTVVALIPDEANSPISPDAAARAGALDHLKRVDRLHRHPRRTGYRRTVVPAARGVLR